MGVFGAVYVRCPECGWVQDIQSNAGDGVTFYPLDEAPLAMLGDIDGKTVECERKACDVTYRIEVITIAREVAI